MDHIYTKDIITKSLAIEPKYINNNINQYILKRLKDTYEGKCLKFGYIKHNSIKIIKRSIGTILASHFNGNVLYNIEFSIDLCNPLEGSIIEVLVKNINKMGIICEIPEDEYSPLNILMARQHHIDNDEYLKLKIGDLIQVKILGKRFEYGDNQISIIAVLYNE